MNNTREAIIIKTLRWICVLPGVIIAYFLSGFLFNIGGISYGISRVDISNINRYGGFIENYILGPMILFVTEMISVGTAVLAGVYIAPDYKKTVYFILSSLLVTLAVVSAINIIFYLPEYQRTGKQIADAIILTIANIFGVTISYGAVMVLSGEKFK